MTSSWEGVLELERLDGRVARAERAREHALARLSTKEGREAPFDPFEGVREVAGRATFVALRELELAPEKAVHRDALLRWVHELLQARVGWDLTIAEAEVLTKVDPELPPRLATDPAEAIARTFEEGFAQLLEAGHPVAIERALTRLGELAPPVAAVRAERRARRVEAAHRLGLDHPWALVTGSAGALDRFARRVLEATDAIASAVLKAGAKRAGAPPSVALAVASAFARDAVEGWPARLGRRWLEELFRPLAIRPPPRVVRLPAPLGGASFLRAASAWGFALRAAGGAKSLPFALAADPYPIEAWTLAGAYAHALAGAVFARRKLGLTSRAADSHARALARPLLFTLRQRAALVLLGGSAPRDLVEEVSARVFGAPLTPALGAVWADGGFSGAARVDAPARLLGEARAHGLVASLVARYDEDWFDNPRAGSHLASIGTGPIWSGDVPDDDAVGAIGRAFEDTLG